MYQRIAVKVHQWRLFEALMAHPFACMACSMRLVALKAFWIAAPLGVLDARCFEGLSRGVYCFLFGDDADNADDADDGAADDADEDALIGDVCSLTAALVMLLMRGVILVAALLDWVDTDTGVARLVSTVRGGTPIRCCSFSLSPSSSSSWRRRRGLSGGA